MASAICALRVTLIFWNPFLICLHSKLWIPLFCRLKSPCIDRLIKVPPLMSPTVVNGVPPGQCPWPSQSSYQSPRASSSPQAIVYRVWWNLESPEFLATSSQSKLNINNKYDIIHIWRFCGFTEPQLKQKILNFVTESEFCNRRYLVEHNPINLEDRRCLMK